MADNTRNHSPNQAVYEPLNGHEQGPLGLSHGAYDVNGTPVVAIHQNADGSLTGVSADGETVQIR